MLIGSLFSFMSRILNGLTRAFNLLMGPLAVGVVIIVLYLWLVKPLVFIAALMLIAFVVALTISRVMGE